MAILFVKRSRKRLSLVSASNLFYICFTEKKRSSDAREIYKGLFVRKKEVAMCLRLVERFSFFFLLLLGRCSRGQIITSVCVKVLPRHCRLVTRSRNELLSIEPDILFSRDALARPFVFLRSGAARIETGWSCFSMTLTPFRIVLHFWFSYKAFECKE